MKYVVSFSETEKGFQPLLSNGKEIELFDDQDKAMTFYKDELDKCKMKKVAEIDFDPSDEEIIANATFLSVVDVTDSNNLESLALSDYFWTK